MLSSFVRAAVLNSGLLIGASAHAQNANVIDQTYGGFSASWSSAGGLIARHRPFVVDGMLVICGGYSSLGGARQKRAAQAMPKESSVKLNGRTAM